MEIIEQAGAFIARHGRAIDQARFAYHFSTGDRDDVVASLQTYQNEDGGFGHGLEPDITAPASNPFATELGLTYCVQAEVPPDHPLIRRTEAYLEQSQDDDGGWRFTPEVYAHPLAPWFQGWEWPNLNPACTLGGLLRTYKLGSPQLHSKIEQLFSERATVTDLTGDDFYAVRPYAYYFMADWQHPQRELYLSGLLWWHIRGHFNNSFSDASHFFAYVRSPDSYVGRRLPAHIIAAQLDRLENEQQPDGGWPSPYAVHWRSPFTIDSLLMLRAFGRI
ncbi:MAG: hypothetical protein HC822_11875 [Oscillochloris sp.]|nr:hypothetical protein [Oscillochloris sp.]